MNKERILALADLIEQQLHTTPSAPIGFTMSDYVHSCGTPACIAGWAAWESENQPDFLDWRQVDFKATKYLGLDQETSEKLFEPEGVSSWFEITPAHAAFTLRHLARAGVVDWAAYGRAALMEKADA
ncbi:hypothetical protein IFT66_10560 [Rhizobium sp. CFBP 13726]|uniref:hypothetical protein n=1 Tax=Rhizobium sp. CFBP 13726 TaxID=2775296 RepID=UPI0017801B64|nr:hypothetical protein [Rhizobium sp. CFBP 13726]MBD8651518.1 hypothetical protein [Rhizobium sp. CFBP 13726]